MKEREASGLKFFAALGMTGEFTVYRKVFSILKLADLLSPCCVPIRYDIVRTIPVRQKYSVFNNNLCIMDL